jgi:hypothetical protein
VADLALPRINADLAAVGIVVAVLASLGFTAHRRTGPAGTAPRPEGLLDP